MRLHTFIHHFLCLVTDHTLAILLLRNSTPLRQYVLLSTEPPHSSTALTIFYILYQLFFLLLHILPFGMVWFWTMQNEDASFLQSVPVLSLLCSSLLCSLEQFSALSVLLVWFQSLFSHLHSIILLVTQPVFHHMFHPNSYYALLLTFIFKSELTIVAVSNKFSLTFPLLTNIFTTIMITVCCGCFVIHPGCPAG